MNRAPGAPRTLSDAKVERVVRLTLESTPTGGYSLEHSLDG